MPKIIRVSLTPQQRSELNQRSRARQLSPRMRDRLEMVRLSDMGLSVRQIAQALDVHEATVRKYLKRFASQGGDFEAFEALADAPIPGRPPVLTDEYMLQLEQMLDQSATEGRTWTCRSLAEWLREQFGVTVHPRYLSEQLKDRKFRWKRTLRSLKHKQKDPQLQAQAQADLETLNL
jgi:transposase